MLDLPKLNPRFKAWYAEQSVELQAAIAAHWDETALDMQFRHGAYRPAHIVRWRDPAAETAQIAARKASKQGGEGSGR